MKLSVLITTYNLEKYIEQTLQSVLTQETEFDFNILIGDDGSCDGTLGILKKWKKKYPEKIEIYVMERNEGIRYDRIERASQNRINLLNHTNSQYVIFLDGDDFYVDKNKLQKQVDILDAVENQDCIACAHNCYLFWDDVRKKLVNDFSKQFKIAGREYWKYGIYFHSDTLMFRNIFKNGIPEEINQLYFDDNLIAFSVMKYGKVLYLPEPMVCYRQIEGSTWNSIEKDEKYVVELMETDIECQQNLDFKRESAIRHFRHYKYFWKNRNAISSELKQKYRAKIEREGLKETEKWLFFSQQMKYEKVKMTIWIGILWMQFLWTKLCKKMRLQRYV